jgi:hypothetical protein
MPTVLCTAMLQRLALAAALVGLGAAQAGATQAYPPGTHLRSDQPHPAVARIIVPEGNATSYGSGTLVDVRDEFGLVITNWHVVRDGQGDVEVVFPDGFRSKARPLKVDSDWDLAALVIWRPPAAPAPMASRAPQSGDALTICGYGQGQYRAATGRCTQYYAPKLDLPQHMVELDVEARQGDSGGPIFNDRGELAGVLFGAGGGTTLGSFGGQVESFLASLAPDIGRRADESLVQNDEAPAVEPSAALGGPVELPADAPAPAEAEQAALWAEEDGGSPHVDNVGWEQEAPAAVAASAPRPLGDWCEQAKMVLAAVGVVAIVVQVLRVVR